MRVGKGHKHRINMNGKIIKIKKMINKKSTLKKKFQRWP